MAERYTIGGTSTLKTASDNMATIRIYENLSGHADTIN